jgi:hypothetical protein
MEGLAGMPMGNRQGHCGVLSPPGEGCPQGGVGSPMIVGLNIFLGNLANGMFMETPDNQNFSGLISNV